MDLQCLDGNGVLIVSFIAFTIVFVVLIVLCSMIIANRQIAIIISKKDPDAETISSLAASTLTVGQRANPNAKDMKKVVAAITAAINASVGGNTRIISVTPVQGNLSVSSMWRTAGIVECLGSRLGSRSW